MGFRVFCDNKGCLKEMEPVLDKSDNKIYCTECNNEINNITPFMKNQMIALGQVKRQQKKQAAFSVRCASCGKENPPVLKKKNLHCSACDVEMTNLAAPFAHAIKEFLKAQGTRNS